MERFRMVQLLKLVGCVVVCELAGVAGALFTSRPALDWYAALKKPAFNPPNWVFAPAWTTLYALMGIAVFIVWRKGLDNPKVKTAVVIFAVQLILNAAWIPAFFGLRSTAAGLIVILGLWVGILAAIVAFLRVSRVSGVLLIPYILWTTFAVALNLSLVALNL